jgi:hypothetical protein
MDKLSLLIISTLFIILLIHIPATIYLWYYTFWWIDTPMHLLGGFFVGLLFFYLIKKFEIINLIDQNNHKNNFTLIIFAISFGALIGILWEFYEFGIDVLILKKYPYYNAFGYILFDTLKDLFNDLVGALWAGIIYIKIIKK